MASMASLASYHGTKKSSFVLNFTPFYKKTDQGGNYSRAETSFYKGFKREETIQGRKLVSIKTS